MKQKGASPTEEKMNNLTKEQVISIIKDELQSIDKIRGKVVFLNIEINNNEFKNIDSSMVVTQSNFDLSNVNGLNYQKTL